MRTLLEAEYADLIAARDERDRLSLLVNGMDLPSTEEALRTAANTLVALCDQFGFVLTAEQWAVPPLAMGRYRTIATIRPARALA